MLYGSVKGNTGCPSYHISEHSRFISIESLKNPVAGALSSDKLKGEPVEWHT